MLLPHLILNITLWVGNCYYPHFADDETEAGEIKQVALTT